MDLYSASSQTTCNAHRFLYFGTDLRLTSPQPATS